MPRYRCHKEVHALKIGAIEQRDDGNYLIPDDRRYAAFWLDPAYISKHSPQPGGYYVVYQDGYISFSPAKAFEEGYARLPEVGR
jgi:hypothetical protein